MDYSNIQEEKVKSEKSAEMKTFRKATKFDLKIDKVVVEKTAYSL
jgi:hypothetical protein